MNYEQQLINNSALNNSEPDWKQSWLIEKEKEEYKYNPTYDYLYEGEVYKKLVNYYKFVMKYPNPEEVVQSIFFTVPEFYDVNKHKLSWVYWIDYKRDEFRKNWKPTNNNGLAYLWLTWNFKHDTSIEKVKIEIDRITNHSIFSKCKLTYCYEFHTEKGSHPHVHMLVELKRTGTINPSDIKDKLFTKNLLKIHSKEAFKYLYSWATGKYIDKRCKNKDIYLAYLSGNKKNEKENNCDNDKNWRQLNNLENLYIKENN